MPREEDGLVYIVTGHYCFAMKTSEYNGGQGTFSPQTRISVGVEGVGCRGWDGHRLTMANGDTKIYGIQKVRQINLEDGKSLE